MKATAIAPLTIQLFQDKCPHRLARLSEGRIAEDGLLECPYHGWAFAGSGRSNHTSL